MSFIHNKNLPAYFLLWCCDTLSTVKDFRVWTSPTGPDHIVKRHTFQDYCNTEARMATKTTPDPLPRCGEPPQFSKCLNNTTSDSGVHVLHVATQTKVMYHREGSCTSNVHLNYLLPLLEYGLHGSHHGGDGDGQPFRWLYIDESEKFYNSTVGHVFDYLHILQIPELNPGYFDPVIGELPSLQLEMIIMNDGNVLELLSHRQPAAVSSGGVTLWSGLVGPFDGLTIMPVIFALLICRNFRIKIKELKLKMMLDVAYKLCFITCNLIALLDGDPTEHWNHFFGPLLRKSRIPLTHLSVCLYGQLFSIDLLTNLVDESLVSLNTFQDLVDYSLATGVNFTLMSLAGELEDWLYYYPKMTQTDRGFTAAVSRFEFRAMNRVIDYYSQIPRREVVSWPWLLGCEHAKMADPLWHSANYHCFKGYAVWYWKAIVINRKTLGRSKFRNFRRLARGTVEGSLARRFNRQDQQRHQLSTMRADIFEPHEVRDGLRDLSILSVSGIMINYSTLIGCILIGYSLTQLMYLLSKKYFLPAKLSTRTTQTEMPNARTSVRHHRMTSPVNYVFK